MRKNNFLRFALLFGVIICTAFVFEIYAGAIDIAKPLPNANQPNAFTIEELNIIPNYAILEGQTLQMQVEEFDEFVLFDSVEWSSSRPDIISCTNSGEIKGLKEGKATITVKAKVGNANDSITVYCARELSDSYSSRIANPIGWTCQTPSFLHFQALHFNIFPIWRTSKLQVKGVYGSYFYVEFEREAKTFKGFILQRWMPSNIASDEIFRQLSTYNLEVLVGKEKEEYKVTTNYKGAVKWTVSDDTIIYFYDKTGTVTGLKGGIATISATVGDKTLIFTVHSIYEWPLEWTGAARQATYVYKAKGTTYEKTSTELEIGDTFTVKGDMGANSNWAYGISESGTEGYIPISHISNKNTISYYNGLNWGWPLENLSYNYVNSPHAPRPAYSDEHRGFDINENDDPDVKQADIEGQKIVSAFDGVVKYIGADLSEEDGCGYYICITSKTVDPVTGKKIIAIYQHMQGWARFSENDEVKKGDWIGNVGNTGRSFGSHLHFEVNNWYAGIGDSGRSDFTYTINPIYFYMDMVENDELILNMDCSAVKSGYSFYFYNYNKRR